MNPKSISAILIFFAVISFSSAQVKYTSDGKLGVGITSPSSTLNVHGASPYIEISNTSETETGILFHDHGYESGQSAKILFNCAMTQSRSANELNFYVNDRSEPMMTMLEDLGGYFHSEIRTNLQILSDSWTGGLRIEMIDPSTNQNGYNMATLYPWTDWYGSLGRDGKEFAYGFIDHVYYSSLTQYSDLRLKENIRDLDKGISIINALRPVYYDYAPSNYDSIPGGAKDMLLEKNQNRIGFIAQEVQKVVPGIVTEISEDGYLGVNVTDMIPILVKALQEQQTQIDFLQEQISESASYKSATSIESSSSISLKTLSQNVPNPFSETTTIAYNISDFQSQALLNIYDLQGKQIRSYDVQTSGSGEIEIPGSEFNPGIYIYNLIVDGMEVDSKRMILTN